MSYALYFLLFVIGLGWSITPQIPKSFKIPNPGDIAFEDIRSNLDFSVEDLRTTQLKKEDAAREVRPVFDQDAASLSKIKDFGFNFLLDLCQKNTENTAIPERTAIPSPGDASKHDSTNPSITPQAFPATDITEQDAISIIINLISSKYDCEINEKIYYSISKFCSGNIVQNFLDECMLAFSQGIIENKKFFMEDASSITIRNLATGGEVLAPDFSAILTLEEAIAKTRSIARLSFGEEEDAADFFGGLIITQLKPNVFPNIDETNRRRQMARERVGPVFFHVLRGEMLVRDGDRFTADTIYKLSRLNELQNKRKQHSRFIGNCGLVILLLLVLFYSLRLFFTSTRRRNETFILIGLTLLGETLTSRFSLFIARSLADASTQYPYDLLSPYYHALPVAACPLLITLLISPGVATLVAFIASMLFGLLIGDNLALALFSFIGGLSGCLAASKYRQRSVVLYAGLIIALANALVVIGYGLRGGIHSLELSFSVLCALIGGLLTTMVAMMLLPLFEALFDITTDIRLLELSSSEQPLLKRLALSAPGTYHHSLIVGALAEAAADAIRANGLLARVASYYHDIGKLEKTDYFIENLQDGRNPHDRLGSNLSKLILVSHVKTGVELAQQFHLGRELIDIIAQHHGNSLIRFFYAKAVQHAGEDNEISEDSFRYPGPRPRTKEAAIVMLSDCIEAASRSLGSVHPSAIRTLVEKVAEEKFLDHQFDDCELTFKELNLIKDALIESLLKYRHQRIAYPDSPSPPSKTSPSDLKASGFRGGQHESVS